MANKSLSLVFILSLFFLRSAFPENILKTGAKSQPITINGDTVEYSADNQEVSATGNVEIIYGDTKLTCQQIKVNMQTKVGKASGHARLEEAKGVIEGEEIIYNFQTKTGSIIDAQFRANPYFGRARSVEKESEKEFVGYYGYATTCSFDRPHYRIGSKRINVIPKEKIQTKDDCVYLGPFPLMYLSRFNQTFEKPLMHVSVLPGKRKDWGPYLLSESRYNLNDNIETRFYLDLRTKLGWAEGAGANYHSPVGNGDIKFYYSRETPDKVPQDFPTAYTRYLTRFRHKWDIDKQTNFIAEAYQIRDDKRKILDPSSNLLKDYFYREYEKDSQPLTYALFHHSFSYSSFDLLIQKRLNHWFDQVSKLPQAAYNLPSLRLGESPFYFEHNSTFASFDKKANTIPTTTEDIKVSRFDTNNKLSLPMKVAFLKFVPFARIEETVYNKGANGANFPARTIFYAGADLSTKFYRVFNVKSNFMGLNINDLRHVVTPTISYSYNPDPTLSSNNIKQIDGIDTITSSNSATLELSNKLQTKRKDANGLESSVDLVDFNVSTTCSFSPRMVYGTNIVFQDNSTVPVSETNINNRNKLDTAFSDILFKLKLLPYAWLRIEADATYKHSGVPSDADFANNKHFSTANYDIYFDLAPERSIGIGQRYQRNQENDITGSLKWRLNPKWRIAFFERYNLRSYVDTAGIPVNSGSLEQEYTITRNLHCWDVDFTFNQKRNNGSSIYIIFRLKAFPENEFGINQNYNAPKSGA